MDIDNTIDTGNEYEIRLEKLKRIQERDGVVYKDKYNRSHTIQQATPDIFYRRHRQNQQ